MDKTWMETELKIHDMIFSIRDLAFQAKEAILSKDDSKFSNISMDMITIANQIYPDFLLDLKEIIYNASFSLHENKLSRDNIGNAFVKNIIDTCKTFLN